MEISNEAIAQVREEARNLSFNAGLAVKQAVVRLSQAAACEELLADGSHTENQWWFLVRAICAECGLDVDEYIKDGRDYARNLVNRVG